jgi:hypothetical protein
LISTDIQQENWVLYGTPNLLRIPLDEHRFGCVGHLNDGTQFMAFGTGCFPDGYVMGRDSEDWQQIKRWIAVLHLFDQHGNHVHTHSNLGGYDIEGWNEACAKVSAELEAMLSPLGKQTPQLGDIHVKLFSVVLDGVTHGLFYTHHVEPEEDYESEWVMLEPRNIMFHPPWDSGEYST